MPRRFDFVSPGVQLTEIDQSTVPTTLEGDGPLIIGRALKGPANKPIRVRSYNDFVAIFGEPVIRSNDTIPDTWRNGNTVSPQYGAIAAQAWLSSEESPITFIRLLGDEETGVAAAGTAGWDTTNTQTTVQGTNGGAYGLYLINSSSATDLGTGTLAAVWYMRTGSIELQGPNTVMLLRFPEMLFLLSQLVMVFTKRLSEMRVVLYNQHKNFLLIIPLIVTSELYLIQMLIEQTQLLPKQAI